MPHRVADHCIDRSRVSANALAVVEKLRAAGFDAYLVGGCVRDLLIGRAPKDFDVATEATPEDVRAVLARTRIVGRRFRIVHVRMRGEIIEVSTFRGGPGGLATMPEANGVRDGADHRGARSRISENGLILRDNAYGAIDEDAFRRDFTVNALYYDPAANVVLDYCGGMADIEARTLRLIGEPAQRLREDPVRILRALRFAAKLSLTLHPRTEEAIAPAAELLADVAPARLFDEFSKMFLHGHGQRAFDLLRKHALVEVLFRLAPGGEEIARMALANTDQRVAEGKPVTPGFLLAAFLWREYCDRVQSLPGQGPRKHGAEEREEAASAVLRAQQETVAAPRRHGYFVRDVWALQPRFERTTPKNAAKLMAHRRFRAAYDFLLLRVQAGEAPAELGAWWTEAQTGDIDALAEARQAMPNLLPTVEDDRTAGEAPKRRRRRRRRGKRLRAELAPALPSEGQAPRAPQLRAPSPVGEAAASSP